MGWFIFIFFFWFSQKSKIFPHLLKILWELDTVPNVVNEEFWHTRFGDHSGKRPGSWFVFPIESHEDLLPWHGYTEKIKLGDFHYMSFRVPQWLEPKIQVYTQAVLLYHRPKPFLEIPPCPSLEQMPAWVKLLEGLILPPWTFKHPWAPAVTLRTCSWNSSCRNPSSLYLSKFLHLFI